MADNTNPNKVNTEQKKARQAEDGKKAMADYEAEGAATRAKTERLRALRLAQEAAAPKAPVKTKAVKKKAASKAKAPLLSEWLSDRKKDGLRD
jgi:hypothetical protein